MNSITSKSKTTQLNQRLSTIEENNVVDWITKQESLGYAPSAQVVRKVVEGILKKNGDPEPLGKHWMDGFKKRHHDRIYTKIGRKQEAERFDGFTPKTVN